MTWIAPVFLGRTPLEDVIAMEATFQALLLRGVDITRAAFAQALSRIRADLGKA